MTLSPDMLTLGVPDVEAAYAFYSAVFSPLVVDHGNQVILDMHGTGRIELCEAAPEPTVFRGYSLNYTVNQPGEVESVLAAAGRAGAEIVKPAKKSLFAGVSAVFRAPDGNVWKLASPTRKDTGPLEQPPKPTETIVILGVDSPKASRDFYAALGMKADRDYGDKFIDFQLTPGMCRFGLMTRKSLAKDAGIKELGGVYRGNVLEHSVQSRGEVDVLISEAVAAGGTIVCEAGQTPNGSYARQFSDPDGWTWRVTSS